MVKLCKDRSSFPVKNNNDNWQWRTAADWSCFFLCFRVLISSRNNMILKASRELWEDCRRDREELLFWMMRNQRKWKEMGAKSSEQAEANYIGDIARGWRQSRTAGQEQEGSHVAGCNPLISLSASKLQTKAADGKPALHRNGCQFISNAIYQACPQKWYIILDVESTLRHGQQVMCQPPPTNSC